MDDTLKQIMADATKRHEENTAMIKEIRASTDTITRNQGASIKALEQQIGQMSKVLQERDTEVYLSQLKLTQEIMSRPYALLKKSRLTYLFLED